MKEVINPAYGRFEDFVRRVPRIFSEEGKTIYKARNEIKVFEVDGVELNVKRYRVPFLINRVIYRFFRQPKAVRAYEYALRLVAKGFETPAPIAHILFRKKALPQSIRCGIFIPKDCHHISHSPFDLCHRSRCILFRFFTFFLCF